MKKILVLIGNYGSGKTELALHFALKAAHQGRTELIDLDMLNAYFRITTQRELLEPAGVHLVSPNFAGTNIEALSLPASISSAFHSDWDTVVFDVGGDAAGATALGRYHADFLQLPPAQLEVLNVVNVRRPLSGTPEKVIALMHSMQNNSRLTITGLINNSNLASESTAADLQEGYAVLREVSRQTGAPVAYTTGRSELLDQFLAQDPDPLYVGKPQALILRVRRDLNSFVKNGVSARTPYNTRTMSDTILDGKREAEHG